MSANLFLTISKLSINIITRDETQTLLLKSGRCKSLNTTILQ